MFENIQRAFDKLGDHVRGEDAGGADLGSERGYADIAAAN